MILAHKRRDSQKMAYWSFNHITVSNCLFLIVYFLAIQSYSFALRYILCSLLAVENTFLLFEVNILKYVSYSKHFLNYHLLLWRLETTFQTMDESQSKNNHEWDHYTIFYWADKIIKIK